MSVKPGSDIKAIWIASVPRTGSMWTFNVTRELVRTAGLTLVPELVPRADEDMVRIGAEHVGAPHSRGVAVLKVHLRLQQEVPRSLFIVPRRDLRDSLVSFMRFTSCDFERGLVFLKAARIIETHYSSFPSQRRLLVDYAEIVSAPGRVAGAIARFIGVQPEEKLLTGIVATLSKENVARRIAGKDEEIASRRLRGLPVAANETIAPPGGQFRVFDAATGFQTGHVSDYVDGSWRDLLTAEQKVRVDALLR